MDASRTREILSRVRKLEIRTRRLVQETMAGQYHSVFKGRGMDFEEVREYLPGDEVRAIDWNVTARSGRPFVKKFTEERELTLMLVVDLSASGCFGSADRSKRELAAETASLLAFSALQNQDKVGLLLFTDRVEQFLPPARSRSHVLRVVRDILFHAPRHTGTDLGEALEFVNRVVRRRAVTFLISDFLSPGAEEGIPEPLRRTLALTARRHDLVAVATTDPREAELPDVGWLTLEDAETGESLEIDTRDAALRRRYAAAADAHAAAVRRALRGSGADLVELRTDQPVVPALRRFFGARARRAA